MDGKIDGVWTDEDYTIIHLAFIVHIKILQIMVNQMYCLVSTQSSGDDWNNVPEMLNF